jgi:FixJ family two-component response regulator
VAENPSLVAIVDDESSVCRALERLLQSAGFDVVTFTHGDDFLESLNTRRPDCLVLDIHMAPMSGFELQLRLSQTAPRIPSVIITGHDTPESYQRVMDAGAAAYLRKPVDDQALIDVVVAAIAKTQP